MTIILSEAAAPSTPASGKVSLYAKTDGRLYFKDDAGSESLISNTVIGYANTQTGAVATGTTTTPYDDSIPQQSTEGNQIMTLAYTPTNSSNKLVIEIIAYLSVAVANGRIVLALHQDSTENAIAAVSEFVGNAEMGVLYLRHEMTAGTTSSTTFKAKAGPTAAATITFNGVSGGRLLGGVAASSMRVTEYKA